MGNENGANMLKKRFLTAVWFDIPLPWFTILVAIWGLLAAYEFFKMAPALKMVPLTSFGMVWILFTIIRPHLGWEFLTQLLVAGAVILPLIWLLFRRNKENAFLSWAWTLAGIFYIGWLLSLLVSLRYGLDLPFITPDEGRNWVFFALLVTFASDTSAFFIGRTWGKHYCSPQISPKKTWEGCAGGVLGAASAAAVFLFITPLSLPIAYGWAALLGALISVFGQCGDLVESLLKRNLGIKDSGNTLPGHGGFLDRIDSILFAGAVVYFYVKYMSYMS
jgi:phosphatidate cytidylyltransferase